MKTSVLESLFNKSADLKACNVIKKDTPTQMFPVNTANFLRTAFFIEHSDDCFCIQQTNTRNFCIQQLFVITPLYFRCGHNSDSFWLTLNFQVYTDITRNLGSK